MREDWKVGDEAILDEGEGPGRSSTVWIKRVMPWDQYHVGGSPRDDAYGGPIAGYRLSRPRPTNSGIKQDFRPGGLAGGVEPEHNSPVAIMEGIARWQQKAASHRGAFVEIQGELVVANVRCLKSGIRAKIAFTGRETVEGAIDTIETAITHIGDHPDTSISNGYKVRFSENTGEAD